MRNKFLLYVIIAILITVIGTVLAITLNNRDVLEEDALKQQSIVISFANSAIETGLSNGLIPYIKETIEKLKTDDSFNAAIVFDEDLTPILTTPDDFSLPELINKQLAKVVEQEKFITHSITKGLVSYNLSSFRDEDGELIGYLMLSFDNQAIKNHINESIKYAAIIAIIIAVFSITLIAWKITIMIAPITVATNNMKELADGNIEINIEGADRTDEIGLMAKAIEIFKENAIEKQKQENIDRKEQEKEYLRTQKIEALIKNFENIISNIIQSVASASSQLYQSAESMSDVINTTSQKADNVSKASSETSKNISSVASATQEMSASIQQISQQISRSNDSVNIAVSEMQKADKTSQLLDEATQKIGAIVDLIQGIAEQINLLALNATIESARAGEAGKGFAVVASEVKNLAGQTSKATEEIGESITSIREVSNQVIQALGSIKNAIDSVNEISSIISTSVEEQSTTTNKISSNMNTASKGTNQINADIGEVSQASSEASASATQTLDAAKMLSNQAENLSKEVDTFLNEIREA